MEITKIKIGSNVYDIKDNAAITASDVAGAVNQALYGSTTAPSGATIVTSENIATIAQLAGISGTGGDGNNKYYTTINNTIYGDFLNGESLGIFYAPTVIGNSGQYLKSNGTAIVWEDFPNTVDSNGVIQILNLELYGTSVKPNNAYPVTNLNIATAIQNSGITTGGASTYAQLGYATSHINGSGALTIAGTDPVYVVTVSANISSVALQTNPTYGHSCHIIFKSADSSSYTVAIGNDSVNRICPTSAGLTLTVPAAGTGYVEVDFLNTGNSTIGDEVYVRGI